MKPLYEKEIDTEEFQYVVGVYNDSDLGKCFRIMQVIQGRGYIRANLFLNSKDHREVLDAIAEAIGVLSTEKDTKIAAVVRAEFLELLHHCGNHLVAGDHAINEFYNFIKLYEDAITEEEP